MNVSNSISELAGYNAVQYQNLVHEAQSKGVSQVKVDEALLSAVANGKSFTDAVGAVHSEIPSLTPPSGNASGLLKWTALPSPGATLVSLIIKQASEQRQQNTQVLFQQGMTQADLIDQQADKIEEGAYAKFACSVAGATVSMTASAISLGVACKGVGTQTVGEGDAAQTLIGVGDGFQFDTQLTSSVTQSISGIGNSLGQMLGAGGELAQGLASAEQKHLEADQERVRTQQETLKQTNDALRDVIAKGLEYLQSMQSNQNQTRTRILG